MTRPGQHPDKRQERPEDVPRKRHQFRQEALAGVGLRTRARARGHHACAWTPTSRPLSTRAPIRG